MIFIVVLLSCCLVICETRLHFEYQQNNKTTRQQDNQTTHLSVIPIIPTTMSLATGTRENDWSFLVGQSGMESIWAAPPGISRP